MNRSALVLSTLALAALSGCPSPDDTNPAVLWLALDGRETDVRLAEEEPEPY